MMAGPFSLIDIFMTLTDKWGAVVADDAPRLPYINFSNWDQELMPDREWAVLDRIPLRQTSLFSGEGGSGKSSVALHLCCAHVLGRDWLGSLPEPGPALFVDAEDDEKEIHIRLSHIVRHYGVTYRDLKRDGLHLISFVGRDAVLATVNRSGKVEATALYNRILEAAYDIKP
jgi:RecA-family ATPase